MKNIPTIIFFVGTAAFAFDLINRITWALSSYTVGWDRVYKPEDAITLLVLAGVAAFIWGRGAVRGEVAEAQH